MVDDPPGDSFTVVDSAGIAVATSSAPSWGEADGWSVHPSPLLQIGEESGDNPYLFFRVAGVLRLSDHGVVVADGQSRELRFFDASGTHRFSVGGAGEGPGELSGLAGLSWCGTDTLHAFDIRQRAHLFSTAGAWMRTLPQFFTPEGGLPRVLSCGAGGRFVVAGLDVTPPPAPGELVRYRQPLRLHDETGEVLTVLDTLQGWEYMGFMGSAAPHPYSRRLVTALDSAHAFAGTGDTRELRVFELEGELVRIIRWAGSALDFTDEDFERYRERRLNRVAPDRRADAERELRSWIRPDQWPAYQSLRLDPDGNLWVEAFSRGEVMSPSGSWTVLSPEGRMLGRVELPSGFAITDIGRQYVLGVRSDEMGVERVEMYRLEKP